jgi:oligopeptide transport system ATP-binding protein
MSLLQVERLVQHFKTPRGILQASRGVDFSLATGQTLALVGESGSGKSTTARAIARLVQPTSGRVLIDGEDILQADSGRLKELRRSVQFVFQDPYSSLDPLFSIGRSIGEPLEAYRIGSRADRLARVQQLLELVGLDKRCHSQHPSSLSGGQRQRVAIARALALEPRIVICDEAVSALDVSVQGQVLNLLADLQQRLGVAYLFITHDLAVVSEVADQVAVMFLGRIVELGSRAEVLASPLHPYTQALLSAAPRLGHVATSPLLLKGEAPSPFNPPSGCAFRLRCPRATALCGESDPQLTAPAGTAQMQQVACHHPQLQ